MFTLTSRTLKLCLTLASLLALTASLFLQTTPPPGGGTTTPPTLTTSVLPSAPGTAPDTVTIRWTCTERPLGLVWRLECFDGETVEHTHAPIALPPGGALTGTYTLEIDTSFIYIHNLSGLVGMQNPQTVKAPTLYF